MTNPTNTFEAVLAYRDRQESAVSAVDVRVQDTLDAFTAANVDGTPPTGVGIAEAAAAAQETASTANTAAALSAAHADILANVQDGPLWASLDSTARVTFPLLFSTVSMTSRGTVST